MKRRENLSAAEHETLATMFEYLPALKTLREFMDQIYALFSEEQTRQQAGCRRRVLVRNAAYQAIPELAKVIQMLAPEKFDKMVSFLRSDSAQQVRTNNHVERANRRLRYLEKVRYKWRRRRSIIRFVLVALDRWRQDHAPTHDHAPSPKNAANKAKPPAATTYGLSG